MKEEILETLYPIDRERIFNKEIINNLPHLRKYSKGYKLREIYLNKKSKLLKKMGGDPHTTD